MPIPALIALGVLAAAAIAGSQYSASEEEKMAKRNAGRQKKQAEKDALLNYWQQQAADAQQQSGFATMNRYGTELRNKQAREEGYAAQLHDAATRAEVTRNQGYIQAGATVAGGIANGAFSGLGSAATAMGGLTADEMANAAGSYALNANNSQLLAEPGQYAGPAKPLSLDDGMGGWQLPDPDAPLTPKYQPNLRLYR